jgi:hypothetical protein
MPLAGFDHQATQSIHERLSWDSQLHGRSVEVVMVAAVGLWMENSVEPQAPPPSRGEVLARYRHLRGISKRHVSDAIFAETVYRTAIADGLVERVAYRDVPGTGDAA